jgi:phosphatidylglycerophosphate synthase
MRAKQAMAGTGTKRQKTTLVDWPADAEGPALRIAGMTLIERHIREAARSGASVVVRAPASQVSHLRAEGVEFLVIGPAQETPAHDERIEADHLLGIRVADSASRRRAEAALMQTCRRPYDGPADRVFIRPVSLRISRLLTRLPIRPNHVTVVTALLGLAACALVTMPSAANLVAAGVLMLAAVVLDSVDGELARVRHMGSQSGMWLDNVSDDILDNVFVACLGIALGGYWLWVGIAAAIGRSICAVVIYVGAAKLGKPGDVMAFRWWFEAGADTEDVFGNPLNPLTLVRSLGRRDVYVLVWAGSLLALQPFVAFALGVINSAVYFALAMLHSALSKRI